MVATIFWNDCYYCRSSPEDSKSHTQPKWSDLVRNLALTDMKTELLGTILNEKLVLKPGTSIYPYETRDEQCFLLVTSH